MTAPEERPVNTRRYWRTIWPDGSSRTKFWTLGEAVSNAGQMKVYGDTPKPKVKLYRRHEDGVGNS